jgi:hypothetical protein
MGRPQRRKTKSPDKQTLQAWEDMRIEIWHELEEGASADIPDTLVDDMSELVVILESSKAEKESLPRLP